jgi:hypothetical protein
VCPLSKGSVHCGRRTGVLYKDGDYFGCRHCYDLAYECQHSKYGAIFSYPDRDKLQAEIKRQYYNGKMTRKYKSLVKKINRTDAKMIALAQTFGF